MSYFKAEIHQIREEGEGGEGKWTSPLNIFRKSAPMHTDVFHLW